MSLDDYYPELIKNLPAFEGPFDANRLQAAGCEVLFATYPAGTRIAEHFHETENVGVITRGELLLTMDGRQQRIGPGEWYHVPARQPHAAEFSQDTAEIEFWFEVEAGAGGD